MKTTADKQKKSTVPVQAIRQRQQVLLCRLYRAGGGASTVRGFPGPADHVQPQRHKDAPCSGLGYALGEPLRSPWPQHAQPLLHVVLMFMRPKKRWIYSEQPMMKPKDKRYAAYAHLARAPLGLCFGLALRLKLAFLGPLRSRPRA